VNELSSYVFSPLREGDIALYRGSGNGLAPILLVAAEATSLDCVERLEHEYALKAELDADWAARPSALRHYNDRMSLVLEDPGGVPADRLLGQAGQHPGGRGKRRGVADGIWHCLASTARAPGPRAAGGDRRDARLHGAGTNRQDESLAGLPQRSLCAGCHFLRNVD
jgi:hypothetical protein